MMRKTKAQATTCFLLILFSTMDSDIVNARDRHQDGGGLKGYMQRLWDRNRESTSTTTTTTTTTPTSSSTSPQLSTSTQAGGLTFTAMEGGANPSTQTITISNTGTGTLSWTATDNASWLNLSPASGTTTTTPSIITLTASTSGLNANTYSGTVTVTPSTGTPSQIAVAFTVQAAAPTIGKDASNLAFIAVQGSNPTSQTLKITNVGKGTLNWSVQSNATWLTLSSPSGTTTTETDSIGISVNSAALAPNTYSATISITDPKASNNPQQVPVSLFVNAPTSGTATLNWSPNTDADLAGYKLYMGTSSETYGSSIDLGNVTTAKWLNLASGHTYFFVVQAYDASGNYGAYSTEVSKSIP
jgi:hypothetical protein